VEVSIDLTPWTRNRFSGIGQSAWRSFLALKPWADREGWKLSAISRDPEASSDALPQLSPWAGFLGKRQVIYHSFELKLPVALHSPKVLTVHDCWTLRPNPFQAPRFQKAQAKKLEAAIGRADRIITPTLSVKQELAALRPDTANRISVVPWGPLLQEEETSTRVTDDAPLRDRPFLLMVACLETRKNHSLLLRALRGMSDLELVLVGHLGYGGEKILAELKTAEANGLRYRHYQRLQDSELKALYEHCLALVQPSLDEGFGMPVLEAMRLGKPVLVSAIAALKEVAGEAALYFDPLGGWETLQAQLKKIQTDSETRLHLGQLSQQRATAFSWEKTASLLGAVYHSLE